MNERLESQMQFCKEEASKRLRALIGGKFLAYVYLLQAGEYIKIGVAKNVEKRVDLLQIGCPFTIEVLRAYPSKDPFRLERLLMWHFRSHRVRGEWFLIPQAVLTELLDGLDKA